MSAVRRSTMAASSMRLSWSGRSRRSSRADRSGASRYRGAKSVVGFPRRCRSLVASGSSGAADLATGRTLSTKEASAARMFSAALRSRSIEAKLSVSRPATGRADAIYAQRCQNLRKGARFGLLDRIEQILDLFLGEAFQGEQRLGFQGEDVRFVFNESNLNQSGDGLWSHALDIHRAARYKEFERPHDAFRTLGIWAVPVDSALGLD